MLLPGYQDEELLPPIVEAIKRLTIAQDHYAQACQTIEGQYLKAFEGHGAVEAAQVSAVRALF